ncbi:MAG: SdpI family protein [Candidatus Omnitrophota bacterium]
MDENIKLHFILFILAFSIILIVQSVRLIKGKVPPNHFSGFRTPTTLSNKEIWYKTNKYAGKWSLLTGIVATVGCLILLAVKDTLPFDKLAWICMAFYLPMVVGGLLAWRYSKKL